MTHMQCISHGTVHNIPGSDRLVGSRSQLCQTTNSLIAKTMSGSHKCAWKRVVLVMYQDISPTHTINISQ